MVELGMVKKVLGPDESGYEFVASLIRNYWKAQGTVSAVLVRLSISYDDNKYYLKTEPAFPEGYDDILFEYDWWEGEKYIIVHGIIDVDSIQIEGGLYSD